MHRPIENSLSAIQIKDRNSIVLPNSPNADTEHTWSLCPTLDAGAELQFAYFTLNEALFAGRLPNCLIAYTRQKNVLGHFCPDRYRKIEGDNWPELALNPIYLALRSDRDSLSTLAHEMCHVERHYFGPLNRKGGRGTDGYHDRPWVEAMKRIGLQPSHTGLPGGQETGYQMTHYIIEGGPFDRLARQLAESGFRITWADNLAIYSADIERGETSSGSNGNASAGRSKKTRVKFSCRRCGLNAWAKPSANLKCGDCDLKLAHTSIESRTSPVRGAHK